MGHFKSLPESNGNRTSLLKLNPLFDLEINKRGFFWLLDEVPFGQILGANGQKQILFPEEAETILKHRFPDPKPPYIHVLLKRAMELKERLDTNPDLTQSAIAKELGISRVRVTQILNLLKLAPPIKQYILTLPQTTARHGPISELRLRRIARIPNHHVQISEFERLLTSTQSNIACLPSSPALSVNDHRTFLPV